jgi:hypothetical protein
MKKHKGNLVAYLNPATRQAAVTLETGYTVKQIDVTKIIPNEKNFYSITGIEELANSLSVSDRQLPPLDVVDNGDGTYRLISGERRLSATLFRMERGEMERAELPCHVLPAFQQEGTLTAEQMETLSIILANNYRQKSTFDRLREVQELEPIARAIYEEEKEKGVLSDGNGKNTPFRTFFAEQILAISPTALQRLKTLENLSDEAVAAFEEGIISKSAATELAALSKEEQDAFVSSIHTGEYAGTRADLEVHLQASNSNCTEAPEEAVFTEVAAPTGEVSEEDKTYTDTEEAPERPQQEEEHSAYDVTSPATETGTEDEGQNEIVSVKEDVSLSDVYEETQGKPLETLLEEDAGQVRLITDALSSSEASDDFLPTTEDVDSSNEPITAQEAVDTLCELLQFMQDNGRTKEAAAIDFALDTMKYRYAWINDSMRSD